MKHTKTTALITAAITAGVVMATAQNAVAAPKYKAEKCYGVAKAGKNDCAVKSLGTSCSGSSTEDGLYDAWLYVPKGTCEKLVGGNLKPVESKDEA